MIESRYSIEYISPESTKDSTGRKPIALIIIICLTLALALAIYLYISSNSTNDFVKTSNISNTKVVTKPVQNNPEKISQLAINTETLLTPIVKTDNSLQIKVAEKEAEATKLVSKNKTLNESINTLTQQLMAERKKNKTLDQQLNSEKNQNNQLSELLESALSSASNADKNYLKAISSLEKTALINQPKNTSKNKAAIKIDSTVKVTAKKTTDAASKQKSNSIRLSTSSQVDAIIAAMQNNTSPKLSSKVIKSDVDKTNEVQLVSVNNSSSTTELLHIQLQRQINQLLESNTTTPIIKNTSYTKALEKESTTRENAVRSITIKKGETLWEIAQRAYGNGSLYKKIISANPQIDINNLYIGQTILVPK